MTTSIHIEDARAHVLEIPCRECKSRAGFHCHNRAGALCFARLTDTARKLLRLPETTSLVVDGDRLRVPPR